MENLITDMKNLNVQNRKIAILENGSWAPQSGKLMKKAFDEMKNMTYIGEILTVKSATVDRTALENLADEIAHSVLGE